MTKDLYETLKIKKDADQSEIKKAYRTFSKKHHPDCGGDEEKFKEISYAYKILSDPEKRKRYDAGETDFSKTKTIKDQALDGLLQLFAQILQNIPAFDDRSMLKEMNQSVHNAIRECKVGAFETKKQIGYLKNNLKRIKAKNNKPNFFEGAINQAIQLQGQNRKKIAKNLRIGRESLRILKDYEEDESFFEVDDFITGYDPSRQVLFVGEQR